jgi:hypothetical protein
VNHHDNAPSDHFVCQILAKHSIPKARVSALFPYDFLSPELNKTLKGRTYYDMETTEHNAVTQMSAVSKTESEHVSSACRNSGIRVCVLKEPF